MADIKLGKLPDRTPIKMTIHVAPDLNQALSVYADMYAERYGAVEPVQELIPAILASFLDSDRALIVRRKKSGIP